MKKTYKKIIKPLTIATAMALPVISIVAIAQHQQKTNKIGLIEQEMEMYSLNTKIANYATHSSALTITGLENIVAKNSTIFKSSKGGIWLLSGDGKIFKYDSATAKWIIDGKFKSPTITRPAKIIESNGKINALVENKLIVFDGKIWKEDTSSDVTGLGLNANSILFSDSKGNLWLSGASGIKVRQANGSTWTSPDSSNKINDGLGASIFEDKAGNIWLKGKNTPLQVLEKGAASLKGTWITSTVSLPTSNSIGKNAFSMAEKDGELLIVLPGANDLMKFPKGSNLSTGKWVKFSKNTINVDDENGKVFVDSNDNIYVATNTSTVGVIWKGKDTTENIPGRKLGNRSNPEINFFEINGKVWVMQDQEALSTIDNEKIAVFEKTEKGSIVTSGINGQMIDVNGNIISLTDQGIQILNKGQKTWLNKSTSVAIPTKKTIDYKGEKKFDDEIQVISKKLGLDATKITISNPPLAKNGDVDVTLKTTKNHIFSNGTDEVKVTYKISGLMPLQDIVVKDPTKSMKITGDEGKGTIDTSKIEVANTKLIIKDASGNESAKLTNLKNGDQVTFIYKANKGFSINGKSEATFTLDVKNLVKTVKVKTPFDKKHQLRGTNNKGFIEWIDKQVGTKFNVFLNNKLVDEEELDNLKNGDKVSIEFKAESGYKIDPTSQGYVNASNPKDIAARFSIDVKDLKEQGNWLTSAKIQQMTLGLSLALVALISIVMVFMIRKRSKINKTI